MADTKQTYPNLTNMTLASATRLVKEKNPLITPKVFFDKNDPNFYQEKHEPNSVYMMVDPKTYKVTNHYYDY